MHISPPSVCMSQIETCSYGETNCQRLWTADCFWRLLAMFVALSSCFTSIQSDLRGKSYILLVHYTTVLTARSELHVYAYVRKLCIIPHARPPKYPNEALVTNGSDWFVFVRHIGKHASSWGLLTRIRSWAGLGWVGLGCAEPSWAEVQTERYRARRTFARSSMLNACIVNAIK